MVYKEGKVARRHHTRFNLPEGTAFECAAAASCFKGGLTAAERTFLSEDLTLATEEAFDYIHKPCGIEVGASVSGMTKDAIESYKTFLNYGWRCNLATVLRIRYARLYYSHDHVRVPHVSALLRAPVVLARYGFWLL